jgi:mannose-1-phosphate guanylyltransferase
VAGRPFTEHQIAIAAAAGVTRVSLGTSYRAEVFSDYFGDGADFGIDLDYRVEDEPLGTGGAIRNASDALTCGPDDPVVVFNGDILTGLDIPALVNAWREADADVALYLTRVQDPRAFGLVPTVGDRVTAFLEKPQTPEEIVTDQINAGCYVFRRSVIDHIPTDRPVSVERETFPALLEQGRTVVGWVDPGYWLDLGTPLAFARGSADIVQGKVASPALPGQPGDCLVLPGAQVEGQCDRGAAVGAGARVGAGSRVSGSVLFDEAVIGREARIGAGSVLHRAVIGDGAAIGAGNELLEGVRVWPDTEIGDCAVRFSSDQ